MYSLVPILIRLSSATVFNMSMLTADVYTLIYGTLVFNLTFEGLYFLSFFCTIFGLGLYTTAKESTARARTASGSVNDSGGGGGSSTPDISVKFQNGLLHLHGNSSGNSINQQQPHDHYHN
jgi:hypothetical protein